MLLDGKLVKKEILNSLNDIPTNLKLSVIQIGNDLESNIYINSKRKFLEALNIDFQLIKLACDTKEDEVIKIINDLNNDSSVSGILIEMPLPSNFNTRKIVNTIDELKDVDGLTDSSLDKLKNNLDCFISPTALSVLAILDYYKIDVKDKKIALIGRSNLVGKPLEYLLSYRGGIVDVCHSKTKNMKDITIQADIVISAVGKPNLVTSAMVKEGIIVIDVGIVKIGNTIVGDVDFSNVKDKAAYITPVPGGVGQVVSVMLAKNIIKTSNNK